MQSVNNFWLKLIVRLGILGVGFVAVIFAFYVWLFVPFTPTISPVGEDASAAAKYEQDLMVLKSYADYDRSFEGERRARDFNNFIDNELRNIERFNKASFELTVAEAVALSGNAHSNISPVERAKRFNYLPLRVARFDDGYYVVQAESEHADLLGARLTTVSNVSIEDVEERFYRYYGGATRRAQLFMSLMILSPELLNAVGISATPDTVDLHFSLDGDLFLVERNFNAIPAVGAAQPYGRELLEYEILNDEAYEWRHLMEESRTSPLYLARPDLPFLYENLDEAEGAYIKLNTLHDGVNLPLSNWLDEVVVSLRTTAPAFAIIDLRFNEGGDDFPEKFAQQLPKLVKDSGPIYIITGSQTFAEAIGAAALIKRYAGERARVAGSLVGDSLRYAGASHTVLRLPNSGIEIPIWTGTVDYARGCWDWEVCDWFSPFFRADGIMHLNPDIFADLDFASYVEGRDPVLDAIMQDVGRGLY